MIALGLGLSLFIGVALGLLGGGGSILAVPILTYTLGMQAKVAIAASLLIIGVTSSVALVPHLLRGRVCFRTAFVFGGASMLGAYFGGRLAHHLPDTWLLLGFGVMMLVTGVAMLRGRGRSKRAVADAADADAVTGARISRLLAHGLGVGMLTGLIGAGGGFLIVPALVLLARMPMRRAIATSLLIIALNSFAGFAGHSAHASLPWALIVPVTGVAAAGSVLGGMLAKRVRQDALRQAFAWLVMLVAVFVMAHQLPDIVHASSAYQQLFVARWPWWVGGIAIASVVVGLLLTENKQLGVSTGCSELCRLPLSAEARASWRPRFLLGIVLGGAVAGLLAGYRPSLAMGGLDQLLPSATARLGVLFGAGTLIGAGARLAGGCTSGHSIVGTALGARASWLATALFMLGGFAATHLMLRLHGAG